MNSTRLPGKALMKIVGRSSIEWIVRRLKESKELDGIVLATSAETSNDALEAEATRLGISIHRETDEKDLIGRFLHASDGQGADAFIRVTADCPLVDASLVDSLIKKYREDAGMHDVYTNVVPNTYPDGSQLELITTEFLRKLDKEIPAADLHREWFTAYLWKNKDRIRVWSLQSPRDLTEYRITLDFPEDLELITKVFEHFGDRYMSLDEIIAFLDANPTIRDIVKDRIDRVIPEGANFLSGAYVDLLKEKRA